MKAKKVVKVLVHGILGNPFTSLKKRIEQEGYEVVNVFFPYQDPSRSDYQDPRLATIGVKDKVDHLIKILVQLQAEGKEYDLVGHSAGALVSLLAACFPGIKPRKKILISPVGMRGIWMIQPSVLWTFLNITFTWGFFRKKVKLSYEKFVYSMLNKIPSEVDRRRIYDDMCEESGKFIFQIGFWPFDRTKATQVQLKNIACNVRILAGDKDRAAPLVIAKATLKRLLKTGDSRYSHTLKVFKGCGHWLFEERPEEIVREICG